MVVISCDVRYGSLISRNPAFPEIQQMLPAQWRVALKETWSKIGWHLFERFVAKHFTREGAAEYRGDNVAGDGPVYQARSGEGESGKAFWRSYNGRKQKRLGQTLAMVFSGATRDGAKRATIYATSNGVRIALSGLVHLNQYKPPVKKYGPHAGEPSLDLRGDVLAISGREREELRALHEKLMTERFGGAIGTYGIQQTQ
jgi:hypothetical protein